jgi:hypothetical protein
VALHALPDSRPFVDRSGRATRGCMAGASSPSDVIARIHRSHRPPGNAGGAPARQPSARHARHDPRGPSRLLRVRQGLDTADRSSRRRSALAETAIAVAPPHAAVALLAARGCRPAAARRPRTMRITGFLLRSRRSRRTSRAADTRPCGRRIHRPLRRPGTVEGLRCLRRAPPCGRRGTESTRGRAERWRPGLLDPWKDHGHTHGAPGGGPGAAVSYTAILDRPRRRRDRRGGPDCRRVSSRAAVLPLGALLRSHAEYAPPSPWRERFAENPYDGEIAYTDAQLGRLLDALRKDGTSWTGRWSW